MCEKPANGRLYKFMILKVLMSPLLLRQNHNTIGAWDRVNHQRGLGGQRSGVTDSGPSYLFGGMSSACGFV